MEFIKKFGPWAIVTGASSGIGKTFTEQLAQMGLNVVLVARSSDKMTAIARKLRSQYQIRTRVIPVDLSEPDSVDVIYVRTLDLDVGLLVSNAGMVNLGNYLRFSIAEVRRSIFLNVSSHAELSYYLGQRIRERRNGRGGIILMSSIVASQGVPYLSLYSAAKAFMLSLGEALHYENLKYGLHVSVITPGPTDTPLLVRPKSLGKMLNKAKLYMLSTQEVVDASLYALENNIPSYTPNWRIRFKFGFLARHFRSRQSNVIFLGRVMKKYMEIVRTAQIFSTVKESTTLPVDVSASDEPMTSLHDTSPELPQKLTPELPPELTRELKPKIAQELAPVDDKKESLEV